MNTPTEQPWLKDCEICNSGLCARIDTLKEEGVSLRKACKELEQESKSVWSASQIKNRYLYYTGGWKPTTRAQSSPRKPLKRTLADTPHPGDPVVAEYESTIESLKNENNELKAKLALDPAIESQAIDVVPKEVHDEMLSSARQKGIGVIGMYAVRKLEKEGLQIAWNDKDQEETTPSFVRPDGEILDETQRINAQL